MTMDINGLQQAQRRNLERIRLLEPGGEYYKIIKEATIYAHRRAVAYTHVDTGALRASHRLEVATTGTPRGEVYIDPAAVNPRSKNKPVEYGVIEQDRGGSHAFYTRAGQEATKKIRDDMADFVVLLTRDSD